MHKFGLSSKLNNISGDRGGAWITFRRYDNDEEIVAYDAPKGTDAEGDVRGVSVHRAELLYVLVEACREREGVGLEVRKRCCGAEVSQVTNTCEIMLYCVFLGLSLQSKSCCVWMHFL